MAEFTALLTAKAEWKPHQIAKAGDIATLAEAAQALAKTVKSTLELASSGMEVVKILSALQNINPLLIALNALADEVLKQITDLKEAGYWYLYIDPYYDKNVTPSPAFKYGFAQLRNEGGERLWLAQNQFGNWIETSTTPSQAQLDLVTVKPFLATPRNIIPGGYNSSNALIDPLTVISPFPQFTVKQVVTEFTKAFDDEGDVPRYKAVTTAPKVGVEVYDVEGNAYAGWNPVIDFGLQLYDKGKKHEDGSVIKDYVVARKPINTKIAVGKPNILGNTEYDGGSGAIAIIIAAGDFNEFVEIFNKFSTMFSDIPEFSASTGKGLLDSLNEILTPANTVIKLTQVDSKYGLFDSGDVLGGRIYGGLTTVIDVNADSIVASTMSTQKEIRITDDAGFTQKFITTVNPNEDERWVDMEIVGKPIRTVDGLNPFIAGDIVVEMEKKGTHGTTGEDEFSNYVMVGENTVEGPQSKRVYPKVGIIAMEKLTILPDSTPPDFGGIQIKDIIPGWGEFFTVLENFVKQLKGMISDSAAFIQDIIDMIKQIQEFLQHIIDIIDEFLEFFQITLPATGVYALYIPNQSEGNEGLKSQISGASGLPDLNYAAGILFVATEGEKLIAGGGSKNPIDLLALVLGLLGSEDSDTPEEAASAEEKAQAVTEGVASAIDKGSEDAEKWKDKSTADKLYTLLR